MTTLPPPRPPPLPESFRQNNRNVFELLGDKYEEIIARLDGLRILAEERDRREAGRRERVEQIAQLDLAMSKTVYETRHEMIGLKRRERLRWWFWALVVLGAALGSMTGWLLVR